MRPGQLWGWWALTWCCFRPLTQGPAALPAPSASPPGSHPTRDSSPAPAARGRCQSSPDAVAAALPTSSCSAENHLCPAGGRVRAWRYTLSPDLPTPEDSAGWHCGSCRAGEPGRCPAACASPSCPLHPYAIVSIPMPSCPSPSLSPPSPPCPNDPASRTGMVPTGATRCIPLTVAGTGDRAERVHALGWPQGYFATLVIWVGKEKGNGSGVGFGDTSSPEQWGPALWTPGWGRPGLPTFLLHLHQLALGFMAGAAQVEDGPPLLGLDGALPPAGPQVSGVAGMLRHTCVCASTHGAFGHMQDLMHACKHACRACAHACACENTCAWDPTCRAQACSRCCLGQGRSLGVSLGRGGGGGMSYLWSLSSMMVW